MAHWIQSESFPAPFRRFLNRGKTGDEGTVSLTLTGGRSHDNCDGEVGATGNAGYSENPCGEKNIDKTAEYTDVDLAGADCENDETLREIPDNELNLNTYSETPKSFASRFFQSRRGDKTDRTGEQVKDCDAVDTPEFSTGTDQCGPKLKAARISAETGKKVKDALQKGREFLKRKFTDYQHKIKTKWDGGSKLSLSSSSETNDDEYSKEVALKREISSLSSVDQKEAGVTAVGEETTANSTQLEMAAANGYHHAAIDSKTGFQSDRSLDAQVLCEPDGEDNTAGCSSRPGATCSTNGCGQESQVANDGELQVNEEPDQNCLSHDLHTVEEDDIQLGGEALSMTRSSEDFPHSSLPDSLRDRLVATLLPQDSFHSDMTQTSQSTVSSVEALLDHRKVDPEVVLKNLGFWSATDDESACRIPLRFLQQTSSASGIDVEQFLSEHEDLAELKEAWQKEQYGMMNHWTFVNTVSNAQSFIKSVQSDVALHQAKSPSGGMRCPKSVLNPANQQALADQGYYDDWNNERKTLMRANLKRRKSEPYSADQKRRLFRTSHRSWNLVDEDEENDSIGETCSSSAYSVKSPDSQRTVSTNSSEGSFSPFWNIEGRRDVDSHSFSQSLEKSQSKVLSYLETAEANVSDNDFENEQFFTPPSSPTCQNSKDTWSSSTLLDESMCTSIGEDSVFEEGLPETQVKGHGTKVTTTASENIDKPEDSLASKSMDKSELSLESCKKSIISTSKEPIKRPLLKKKSVSFKEDEEVSVCEIDSSSGDVTKTEEESVVHNGSDETVINSVCDSGDMGTNTLAKPEDGLERNVNEMTACNSLLNSKEMGNLTEILTIEQCNSSEVKLDNEGEIKKLDDENKSHNVEINTRTSQNCVEYNNMSSEINSNETTQQARSNETCAIEGDFVKSSQTRKTRHRSLVRQHSVVSENDLSIGQPGHSEVLGQDRKETKVSRLAIVLESKKPGNLPKHDKSSLSEDFMISQQQHSQVSQECCVCEQSESQNSQPEDRNNNCSDVIGWKDFKFDQAWIGKPETNELIGLGQQNVPNSSQLDERTQKDSDLAESGGKSGKLAVFFPDSQHGGVLSLPGETLAPNMVCGHSLEGISFSNGSWLSPIHPPERRRLLFVSTHDSPRYGQILASDIMSPDSLIQLSDKERDNQLVLSNPLARTSSAQSDSSGFAEIESDNMLDIAISKVNSTSMMGSSADSDMTWVSSHGSVSTVLPNSRDENLDLIGQNVDHMTTSSTTEDKCIGTDIQGLDLIFQVLTPGGEIYHPSQGGDTVDNQDIYCEGSSQLTNDLGYGFGERSCRFHESSYCIIPTLYESDIGICSENWSPKSQASVSNQDLNGNPTPQKKMVSRFYMDLSPSKGCRPETSQISVQVKDERFRSPDSCGSSESSGTTQLPQEEARSLREELSDVDMPQEDRDFSQIQEEAEDYQMEDRSMVEDGDYSLCNFSHVHGTCQESPVGMSTPKTVQRPGLSTAPFCRQQLSVLNLDVCPSPAGKLTFSQCQAASTPEVRGQRPEEVEAAIFEYQKLASLINQPVSLKRPALGPVTTPCYNGPTHSDKWRSLSPDKRLSEESRLMQQAIDRYKMELRHLENSFNAHYSKVYDMMTEEERDEIEELQLLRAEVYKEVCETERLMISRSVQLSGRQSSLQPLASLDAVHQMIELLKEQMYQRTVVLDLDSSMDQILDTSSSSLPLSPWEEEVSELKDELRREQRHQQRELEKSFDNLKVSLLDEVRSEIQLGTQSLYQELQSKDQKINALKSEVKLLRRQSLQSEMRPPR